MNYNRILDKARAKEQAANEATQTKINGVFNGGNNYSVSGSNDEIQGRIEGLERAKTLTGQNPYEIGADYQEAYGNIKKRASGSDTGSELLRASKAGAVADARNQLQAQGVKGGAALGAVSQVERAKSYDVNNQLMDHQRKGEMDFMNAVKSNANFTTGLEMGFGGLGAENGKLNAPQVSNGFGTVICTELYKRGYYSDKIYQADITYGAQIKLHRPEVYVGYRLLADPIVSLMQKSPIFTRLVAVFAVPWARNMAGEKNLLGGLVSLFGEPLCSVVGKIKILDAGEIEYGN